MNRAKRILRWMVGIGVGLYLALVLLPAVPIVQRWLAEGVGGLLERTLDTRVEVGRISIGWNMRVVMDDLVVWDQEGEEMLNIARLGARISVPDLIHKRIRIGNAQLFGLHANLYRPCPDCPPNFKFFIDAFASKDTTRHTPLDLRITQLLVRRGEVWYSGLSPNPSLVQKGTSTLKAGNPDGDEKDTPKNGNPDEDAKVTAPLPREGQEGGVLHLTDLNLTAQLNALTDDSINLRVRRLDVCEERGLCIKSLKFNLEGNQQEARLTDFDLQLPNSSVAIPLLTLNEVLPFRLERLRYCGTLQAHLSPTDLAPFVPAAARFDYEPDLALSFHGQGDNPGGNLRLWDERGLLSLSASGQAERLREGKEGMSVSLQIDEASVENAFWQPFFSHDILNRIGRAHLTGQATWAGQAVDADLNLRTPLGELAVKGTGTMGGQVDATVKSDDFQLGTLLDRKDLGLVALDMAAQGTVGKEPDLTLSGTLPEVDYRGYRYHNISLDGQLRHRQYEGQVAIADANVSLDAEGSIDLTGHHYRLKTNIGHIAPNTLNLTKRYQGAQFSGELVADIEGTRPEDLTGTVQFNQFCMTDSTGQYRPGDIHVTSAPEDGEVHIRLISPFVEAQVQGTFEPKVLVGQVRRMLSQYLPTIKSSQEQKQVSGKASFTLRAYNAEPLRRLLDIPLTLDGTTTATGEMDSEQNALWLTLKAPGITYGNEQLHDTEVHIESNYESVFASASTRRMMKGRWVDFGVQTQGNDGKLSTRLYFDNQARPSYAGEVNVVSRLWQDPEGRQGFEGSIQPSTFTIGDTLWTIHPGFLSYYDGVLQVDSFEVTQDDRFIRLNGRASRLETDTLHAQLRRMNLEYIFSLINFHAVELTGEATGEAYAHSLFSAPKADAYIRIPQFALNYGVMGDLDIHLNWGDKPYAIFLDGEIEERTYPLTPDEEEEWFAMPNLTDVATRFPWAENEEEYISHTLVKGYITPKKDIDYHGLDLNVAAQGVNLEFINKWTANIFDDLQGRATGWIHIFGPFKQVNIEGDAVVDEASVGIPFTGVRYHVMNDSVQLRPDNIYFLRAHLYDPQGDPDVDGHSAIVNGHLHHDHFKNLSYDIDIQGDNILGYNFTDFADMNFYGTVLATGSVHLQGYPGSVNIDIKARPERGTTFTYNVTSPDKITNTPFVTYRPTPSPSLAGRGVDTSAYEGDNANTPLLASEGQGVGLPEEGTATSSDLRINFDLDIDQQSTMNLLMDARSGDKITINGNGRMAARYYNKGAFELFGTYYVNRGTYNLSLQEIIRKKFEFSDGGTIAFNGEPYDADLNLQAVYPVSGVSLNDINPKANFSNSSARVNCLMNIGGKARAPRITFDFDILNANEDEKQMVRSLISTEEERNMQVIYLLGIGRFYAYDYANTDQNQSTTAMYSVLSSTLSGTINQAISNMMGTTNWNFGANLRTGQDGWDDMDVEGMLQGNLLNNRLLINGNFGYRDNPMANSNFIGDFDVKYLLTRTGSVALKAYSETNDRYFTKSSLTTQGIGILLKKDFTSWKDLVGKGKRKGKKKGKD